eukprot:747175-Hanusia_phi.AAC.9
MTVPLLRWNRRAVRTDGFEQLMEENRPVLSKEPLSSCCAGRLRRTSRFSRDARKRRVRRVRHRNSHLLSRFGRSEDCIMNLHFDPIDPRHPHVLSKKDLA